ncbi:hypothetical protein LCGC14_1636780 [marine sediment metagenome]|uniref:G8 domain-containing protein n=1 Tax=marine sediment metagenome TaxID=412755 RepID=A0A0F9L0H4_9ZZZZ
MAVIIWEGTTDDFQTAGNWSTAAVPVDGDEVIFDGRVTQSVAQGMLDSETGLATKGDYDLLHIKKGFTGDVGTAAEPLCCTASKVIMEGSGTLHLLCGEANQSTDATIPLVIVNNPDATVYLYSNANDGANLCEFTTVYILAGIVYLAFYDVDADDQGVYVKDLYINPRDNKAGNVTVSIQKDAYDVKNTVATNIYMQNGTLTTDSQVGIFEVYKGTVNYGTDLAGSPETDLNITTLRIYGGTFNWTPDDSGDDAYIGDLWLFGGALNASSATNNDRAKVLGNGPNKDIRVFKGAVLNIANNKGNITLDAASQLWSYDGTIKLDRNSSLSFVYNI